MLLSCGQAVFSQQKPVRTDKFRQLAELLPTPNERRTASGAPGPAYWQQRADYVIDVEIDEKKHRVSGSETITYTNNSPHELTYLWLQLDPNLFSKHSYTPLADEAPELDGISYKRLRGILYRAEFDGSITISSVKDAKGRELPHKTVKTMMRVDLPSPLESGGTYSFSVAWSFALVDLKKIRARSGQEVLDDGNAIYSVAQWYPRMCAYTDVHGWRHRQYIGGGEFTLEFGSFLVKITVPDDHIVASTGTLQNPAEVLSKSQRERLAAAAKASGSTLRDVRENNERDVARRQNISADCLRVHTVGHDCSVGKMVVSIEVARGLARRGVDAKFIATGQTGMLVEGDGCPVDAVVTDFISGAVEKQILAHQHHEVLVIEGQGSITHPCYSAVTLGLLHGCLPDGLIYCYEMGRKIAKGAAHVELPSMESQRELYHAMANAAHPCRFIGVAINSRTAEEPAYRAERDRIKSEWNLPAWDVFRENAEPLGDAVLEMRKD